MDQSAATDPKDILKTTVGEFNEKVAPDLWDLVIELDRNYCRTPIIQSWLTMMSMLNPLALRPEQLSRVLCALEQLADSRFRAAMASEHISPTGEVFSGRDRSGAALPVAAIEYVQFMLELSAPHLAGELITAAEFRHDQTLREVRKAREDDMRNKRAPNTQP